MKKLAAKFPQPVIFAHWITLILVLIAYFTSKSPIQDETLGQIHVIAGGLVFIFFFIRLILYFIYHKKFPKTPPMLHWQENAFKFMKFALYFCLFTVPLLGWLALSSMTTTFYLFDFSVPLADLNQTNIMGPLHQVIANVFISLVGLHATAALFHHFFLKDDVLNSMR